MNNPFSPNFIRYILSLGLYFVFLCANSTPLRHHIIIAIDRSGCDKWTGNAEFGQEVQRLLLRQSFSEDSEDNDRTHLFEEGDYISFVGFRINHDQTDMNVFAMPLLYETNNFSWLSLSKENLRSTLGKNWNSTVLQSYNPGDNGFSLVSVSKAYALRAVPSYEGKYADRTFLIMITDHHYNGNDFYDEIRNFIKVQKEKKIAYPLNVDSIFAKSYNVEQNYYIRYISHKEVDEEKYVEFYEYVPLPLFFSIQSVIRYPTNLRAVRNRDGSFEVKLPIQWIENKGYHLLRLEAFPNETDQIMYSTPNNAIVTTELPDNLRFILHDNKAKYIQIRGWLILNDGFYNGTLLSADSNNPRQTIRDGLNVLITIDYDADATIWGSKKLAKFGWFLLPLVDDQYRAAHIWEYYILPLMVLLLLAYLGYRLARTEYYTPKASEFIISNKDESPSK